MPVSEGSSLFDWNESDSYSSPNIPWPLMTIPFLDVRIHDAQWDANVASDLASSFWIIY